MFFTNALYLLAAAGSVLATNHKGIPKAFAAGFDTTGTEAIQVAYDTVGDITDGQDLTGEDLSKVAKFSLGDSSGINVNAKYIVLMLDPDVNGDAEVTNPQRLHYLRTDFAPSSGTGVQISSEQPPAVKYVGPEATTDANGVPVHRYVYLLYKQPKDFVLQGVDSEQRDGFDVKAWRELNGLEPAIAGLHFLSTVGGGEAPAVDSTVTQEVSQTIVSTPCTTSVEQPAATTLPVNPPPAETPEHVMPEPVEPAPVEISTHFVTVTADCACTTDAAIAPPAPTAPAPIESAIPPAPAAPAATHTVIVGGPAGLVYTPEFISANPGDLVVFDFLARNHTVTQSTLDLPCVFKSDGVKSGFRANPDSIPGKELFEYTVPDAEPKWFYCAQGNHCQQGMVFAINPKDKFPKFLENAKGNSTAGSPTGGIQQPQPTNGQGENQFFDGAGMKFGPSVAMGMLVAGVMAALA